MPGFYFNGFLFGWENATIYCSTCIHFKNHYEDTNLLKKPILINFSQLYYFNMKCFLKTVQQMFLEVFQKWHQRLKVRNDLILWIQKVVMSNNKSCKTLYECVEDYSIRMFYLTCQALVGFKTIFQRLLNFVTKFWTSPSSCGVLRMKVFWGILAG